MAETQHSSSVLEFFMLVGKLKHTKRTGWVRSNVSECETIAGHMYRMSVMAFLLDGQMSPALNKDKCIKMSIVHDIAECIVGDLTPFCGVSAEEKHKREVTAMKRLSSLVSEKVGEEILSLFMEYEEQQTVEAKAVKDLDKFDMILQAYEYEKESNNTLNLQQFFNSTEEKPARASTECYNDAKHKEKKIHKAKIRQYYEKLLKDVKHLSDSNESRVSSN